MFELIDVFWAFITIALLVLVGRFIRQRIGLLRSPYIPSSVVAGAVGLLCRTGFAIMSFVPLFSIALIGGIIVQLMLMKIGKSYTLSRPLVDRIGGMALDVTIVTALATISLNAIGANFIPFPILAIAGIAWNVCAFRFLAPRMLPV